uniref:Transcription factor ILR3 n=1 Tax=Anthurium amnicola TaxID=1678845 RepID=A0A1D1Y7S3_9ARAE
MGSGQNNGGGAGWFLDFGGMEDEVQAAEFTWPSHFMDDPTVPSTLDRDLSQKEGKTCESTSKKRNRVNSCAGPGTKACREKIRRDRLNDRFVELCSILDPGRPPKADKVAILSDATRHLNQLHVEAEKLKESNESLQETIKSLKAEKMELRDEKVSLKAEKEKLEQMLKGLSIPSSFVAPPVAAPFHPAAYATCNKNIPYPNYPPVGMWQWIPPASLDTSQDHVLRPPVA